MQYRGSTWPQTGDDVRIVKTGLVGLVEDITGRGSDERFVVSTTAREEGGRPVAYALKEIRRA